MCASCAESGSSRPASACQGEAEETISYRIPTFKHRGKYLIYFAAFEDHMSVYPTVGAVEATEGTKGTFRFEAVKAIVAHRLEVIEGRAQLRDRS